MNPKSKVPRIPHSQLTAGPEISVSSHYVFHKGFIRTPGSKKITPVCYKTAIWDSGVTTADMEHEALVLMKLKGVSGVPRLYGITNKFPAVFVMSLCSGRPLKQLQRSPSARTYLAAIREACIVLGQVHRRGIVHGNISASNILVVTRRNREDVSVSIVGFDHAEITKDKYTRLTDSDSLVFLLHEMADRLSEYSPFYRLRDKLRLQRDVNLTGIVRMLCSVMHENPANCPKCKKLRPGN